MSIGVVVNPRSRQNLRHPDAALRLARALGDHGVVREVHSLDDLHRTAEDFKRLQIDVLGISGGDGTNHVTITGFLSVYAPNPLPQLAFLRGGTMNTVANSVGIRRGRPEGVLGRVIRAYAERAVRPLANVERHVMRIGPLGSKPDMSGVNCGFLFGTGVVYGFLAEYYRNGEPSPLVAAKTLARGVGSTFVRGETIRRMAKPFRGTVTIDDGGSPGGHPQAPGGAQSWETRDYLSIAAGTIDQIGLNFRPFYRYDERPSAFHLLGIYASPFQFVCDLPRIAKAQPMRPNRTFEAVTPRAIIESADGTMRYMIDGDLHEVKGPLEVSIGPRVKILVTP